MHKREADDVALIRVEQLYPFPRELLAAELKRYKATDVVWCQEEPHNQGAWYQIRHHLVACLSPTQALQHAGRARSPSPRSEERRVGKGGGRTGRSRGVP